MERVVYDLHLSEFRKWLVRRGYSEETAAAAVRQVRRVLTSYPRAWRQQSRSNLRWALRHYFRFLDEEVISGGAH